MKCSWCANPEGMAANTELVAENTLYKIVDTHSILDEIESCKPMFFDGGGVTFTGGEPTIQFEALKELLEGSHAAGINTAIESNATHRDIDKLFPFIDQLILDFKFANDENQIQYTGISNKQIKANFRKAFSSGKPMLVRIPVINNINANEEEILEIIKFMISNNPENAEFELLAYHEYGKVKWEKCGKDYTVIDGFVSGDRIQYLEKLFSGNHLVIKRT
jgi:pyruvate formate lyase activating enzyme